MSPKMLIVSGERLVGNIDVSFDTLEEAAKVLRKAAGEMEKESKKSQDAIDLHNLADDFDRSNLYIPRHCKDCGHSVTQGKTTLLRMCPGRFRKMDVIVTNDAICENPDKFYAL